MGLFDNTMMENIFPIINGPTTSGNGFAIGDLFITAAHVVHTDSGRPAFFTMNGERIILDPQKAVFYENSNPNNNTFKEKDLAIFRVAGLTSRLKLDDKFPEKGDELLSKSYNETQLGTEPIITKSLVNGQSDGDFFAIETQILVKSGSSGSPVVDGNIVKGMIVAGDETKSMCVCLSASYILNIIKNVLSSNTYLT